MREHTHNISDYTPSGRVDDIPQGAFYLHHCDAKHRRVYKIRGQEQEGEEIVSNGA